MFILLEKNSWNIIRSKNLSKLMESRRAHFATIIDEEMIVYGGLNSHG